jgi:WD40 repeat protein
MPKFLMMTSAKKSFLVDLRIALVVVLTAAIGAPAQAGIMDGLLKRGVGDGKIAKYQFTLHDSMVVTSVAWSPDGKYIAASSSQSADLHLWDVAKRKLVANVRRDSPGYIGELSWSPDGRYLPICGGYGKLRIYTSTNLSVARTVPQQNGLSCDVTAFSADGSLFAALGITSRSLEIYSTKDWRLVRHYDNSIGWARGHAFDSIAFIPGALTLAVGGGESEHRGYLNPTNGFIYFYNPGDLEPSRRIQAYWYDEHAGLPGPVLALAFSPDGTRVATGTDTGAGPPGSMIKDGVRVFNMADGSIAGRPLDGTGLSRPGGLQYTSDGRFLITGHAGKGDSLIHIIDGVTIHIADAVPAGGTVYDVTTNPRGSDFAAGVDNSIVVWSLPGRPTN